VTEHTLELTNLRNTYEKRLTEIITSNAQAVIDAQGRISREMAQKWDKLYAEEQGKVQDLTASLESANEKLAAAEEEMTRVAYETKKKAYEKVKAQFDSGNKEFQKLKSSLREVVLEKEKSERKATQQEALVVELRAEVQSLKDGHQGLRSQLSEIETILKTIPLTFEAGAGAAVKDQLIALRAAFEAKLLEHQQTVTSWESRTIDLKSQISSLESTLKGCQGEKALLETQLGKVQQEAKLSAEAAESLRGELTGLKHERDSQLLAIGNVLQEKHQLEEELQRKAGEVGELVSRCEGLRQMNEEIVCMLEKVYQQQPQEGGA
jgi:chromosome segregation ATPase